MRVKSDTESTDSQLTNFAHRLQQVVVKLDGPILGEPNVFISELNQFES